MFARIYSFKFIILTALIWLGLLAYGLAFYSTHVYSEHAIENQTSSLQSILGLKSREKIDSLYRSQKRFAYRLQAEAPFVEALDSRDRTRMEAWLAESFSRYQASTGKLELVSLVVRSLDGEIFAQSSAADEFNYHGCPIMLDSLNDLLLRQLKPVYGLCTFEDNFFSEVLVPVGTFEPKAYLQVISDAIGVLKSIETDLELPLKITSHSGKRLYQSDNWVAASPDNHLYPVHRIYGKDALLGAQITGSFDQQTFISHLSRTEYNFFLITTLAIFGALVLVVFLLNRAFMPMNKLRNSVGALLTGKYAPISEEQLPNELRDLVVAYNEMVEGLESETISRRQNNELKAVDTCEHRPI